MSKKHYSVRKSAQFPKRFKIVIVGGFWGYADVDLPTFDTLEEALAVAERLNRLRDSA